MAKFKNVALFVLSIFMLVGVCISSAGCLRGDKVEELKQYVEELENKINEQGDKIAELEADNKKQNDRIDKLEEENTNLSDRIRCLELKGGLCSLFEAYDLGLLSRNDLLNISYYHYGERHEMVEEDFVLVPKTPDVLSEETDVAIRQAYCRYVNPNSDKTIDDVYYSYYGTYNNCVAINIGWNIDGPYPDYDDPWDIDGVWFKSSQWFRLMVFIID